MCEPQVIHCEKVFEGWDDGVMETSDNYIYNCQECDCIRCEHYYDFNPREREIDEEFEEDVNELNRRLEERK